MMGQRARSPYPEVEEKSSLNGNDDPCFDRVDSNLISVQDVQNVQDRLR